MNKRDQILTEQIEQIEQIMRDHLTARKVVSGEGRDSQESLEVVGFAFTASEIVAMLRMPVGS